MSAPPETPWDRFARSGRVAVVNPNITEADLDAITADQVAAWRPIVLDRIEDKDLACVDYGCGPGRFEPELAKLFAEVVGYDPCAGFLDLAPRLPNVAYTTTLPRRGFDAVFVWAIFGGLEGPELEAAFNDIAGLLRADGLLFFAEHTPERPPGATAWHFRPADEYVEPFRARGIPLERVGSCRQYQHEIMFYAGRKAVAATRLPLWSGPPAPGRGR